MFEPERSPLLNDDETANKFVWCDAVMRNDAKITTKQKESESLSTTAVRIHKETDTDAVGESKFCSRYKMRKKVKDFLFRISYLLGFGIIILDFYTDYNLVIMASERDLRLSKIFTKTVLIAGVLVSFPLMFILPTMLYYQGNDDNARMYKLELYYAGFATLHALVEAVPQICIYTYIISTADKSAEYLDFVSIILSLCSVFWSFLFYFTFPAARRGFLWLIFLRCLEFVPFVATNILVCDDGIYHTMNPRELSILYPTTNLILLGVIRIYSLFNLASFVVGIICLCFSPLMTNKDCIAVRCIFILNSLLFLFINSITRQNEPSPWSFGLAIVGVLIYIVLTTGSTELVATVSAMSVAFEISSFLVIPATFLLIVFVVFFGCLLVMVMFFLLFLECFPGKCSHLETALEFFFRQIPSEVPETALVSRASNVISTHMYRNFDFMD